MKINLKSILTFTFLLIVGLILTVGNYFDYFGIGSGYFIFYIIFSGIVFAYSQENTKIIKSILINIFVSVLFSGLLVGINCLYMVFYILSTSKPEDNVHYAPSFLESYLTLFLFLGLIFFTSAFITTGAKNILLKNKKGSAT